MIKNLFKAFFRKDLPLAEVPISTVPKEIAATQAVQAAHHAPSEAAARYHERSQERRLAERDRINACNDLEALRRYCDSHSGHIREIAIQRCVALCRPELLALVLERLNDWVPEVRDAARGAVLSLMTRASEEEALALLPAVHRLENLKRSDHRGWIVQFEKALIGKIPLVLFIGGLEGTSVPLARSCFRIIWHHDLMEARELIRRSLERSDDIVIARLSVQACAGLPQDEQLPAYQAALRSHFGNVRTHALRALMKLSDKESRCAVARDAIWDAQAAVRAVAVFYLRTDGIDMRSRYLEALVDPATSTQRRRIALSELGNTGTPADIGLLRSFSTSRLVSTRLAALTAWFKLEPSAKDEVARQALLDASPRVRRLAVHLVTEQGAFLPADFIRETMAQHGETRVLAWMLPSGRL